MAPPSSILLVEDAEFQALMLRGLLETGGVEYDVVHVSTLADALSCVRSAPVACVLLDLTLPDATGLEAVVALRNEAPDVAIVVTTADEDEGRAIKAMQLGAQDYLSKTTVNSQVLARAVVYAIERKRAELAVAELALHDALTGLPNRELFTDRLRLALARAERWESGLAVLFLDLDRFKAVNDGLGHPAGDTVLRSVAARLLEVLRPGDSVARFGGDEFTLLASEIPRVDDAVTIAQRISEGLAPPFRVGDVDIDLGVSIGIALAPGRGEHPDALIARADRAMYVAKRAGRVYEVAAEPDRMQAT